MTTKELLALVDSLQESITDWGDNMRNEAMVDLLDHTRRIRAALPALCAEVEALTAERDAMDAARAKAVKDADEVLHHFAAATARAEAAEAQVEAMRKDAARYQMARRILTVTSIAPLARDYSRFGDFAYMQKVDAELDAAIDAARSRNEHEG